MLQYNANKVDSSCTQFEPRGLSLAMQSQCVPVLPRASIIFVFVFPHSVIQYTIQYDTGVGVDSQLARGSES